jgi:ABC-type xylose transport system substrate-binding protein
MNKFFVSILLTLFIISAHSQTVTVMKQNEKLKNESIDVFAITLEGKKEDISSAWNKFLRENGKVRPLSFTNPIIVSEPVMNGTTYTGKAFYADLKKNSETSSTVWAGINPAEWEGAERK